MMHADLEQESETLSKTNQLKKKEKKNANFQNIKLTHDKTNKLNESGLITPTKEQHQHFFQQTRNRICLRRQFPTVLVHLQR